MIDQVIGIAAGKLCGSVLVGKGGQLESRTKLDQHILEGPYVPVELQHGLTNSVRGSLRSADGSIENADAIKTLQVGGIR